MTSERFEELVEIAANSHSFRSALTAVIPFIRNEVIEECAKIAEEAWLVPPDGGCPADGEVRVCDEASRRILTLKTKEPT